jgi:hypothetical protein
MEKIPQKIAFDQHGDFNHRYQTLAMSVKLSYTTAVEGDIAEFGISLANSWRLIAAAMSIFEPQYGVRIAGPRHLHGFDSFRGLPAASLAPDTESPLVQQGIWGEGKCGTVGQAEVNRFACEFLPQERVHLYPGWFSETLPTVAPHTKFALVHLDCDLYESSAQVLTDLFENDRLSDGAILLFDDFLENRSSPDLGQRKAWEECKARFAPRFTDLGFYGLCCWRCIIHK